MQAERRAPGRARPVLFWLIIVFFVLAIVEGGAAVATSVLLRHGWMANLPEFSERDVSRYLGLRNPWLGWGPPTTHAGRVVGLAPRPDPLSVSGPLPCVSVYGDSFTYGYDVAADETYPHYLAQIVRCPVSNYGVEGYGSDQALMLFRAQQHLDSAPVVILGHLSENILRNVSRYRGLLYPGAVLQFKPRFVVRGDRLGYVPIPVNSMHDFRALEENPDSVLAGDALLARPRRRFPYSIALVRWLTQDFKVRATILGVPSEAVFYAPTHPAEGLGLTVRILSTFVREAAEQERQAVVLLIPTSQALTYAANTGVWADQPLADALKRRHLPVIHAGPRILERLAGADPCSLFDGCKKHHFNRLGNQLLAGIVVAELRRMRLLPPRSSGAAEFASPVLFLPR